MAVDSNRYDQNRTEKSSTDDELNQFKAHSLCHFCLSAVCLPPSLFFNEVNVIQTLHFHSASATYKPPAGQARRHARSRQWYQKMDGLQKHTALKQAAVVCLSVCLSDTACIQPQSQSTPQHTRLLLYPRFKIHTQCQLCARNSICPVMQTGNSLKQRPRRLFFHSPFTFTLFLISRFEPIRHSFLLLYPPPPPPLLFVSPPFHLLLMRNKL